jgi:DUF2971 family protein
MSKMNYKNSNRLPFNGVELQKQLLVAPHGNKLLYKVMRTEDLIRSVSGSYLHFNRVDSYDDAHDGEQLLKDLPDNQKSEFYRAKGYSAADHYKQSRSRTYACCFSMENSNYIWRSYGNGENKGKVCIVFKFGKLRSMLNEIFRNDMTILEYKGKRLKNLFSLNYGLIEYIDCRKHKANKKYLQNPIIYTYFKDRKKYSIEKELRITLSYLPSGHPIIDGKKFIFPKHLHMHFDFGPAIGNGVLNRILHSSDRDTNFLHTELKRFSIFKNENEKS